jgi:signal transduction histidine kinase
VTNAYSEQIFAEQVALSYKLLPVGIIASLINSAVVTALLFNLMPPFVILSWFISLLAVSIIRLLLYKIAIKESAQKKRTALWANLFIAGIFLSGSIWGCAAFFALFHLSLAHQILVAYVLGGMAAGASSTFNSIRRAYFAFSIPVLLPQIIVFIISGEILSITMGGMLVLFWLLITASAITNYQTTETSFRLRYEREDLILSLQNAQEQTVKKNAQLQKEIRQRELAEAALLEEHALLEKRVEQRTLELNSVNQELTDFTHSVAHDLRSPLLSIKNFAEMLDEESGGSLKESSKESLFYIRKSVGRMQDLIRDLLLLARVNRDEISKEAVNLSEIVADLFKNLRIQYPERDIELTMQPGITAECDPRLIRIVLENLIGNAWKYTGRTKSGHIEFSSIKKGQELIYCVKDNGVGFDMRYADRLFVPFKRLHSESAFPGTGIGLATVHKIITRHGGRIWAESTPGNGAQFYFTLERD